MLMLVSCGGEVGMVGVSRMLMLLNNWVVFVL